MPRKCEDPQYKAPAMLLFEPLLIVLTSDLLTSDGAARTMDPERRARSKTRTEIMMMLGMKSL